LENVLRMASVPRLENPALGAAARRIGVAARVGLAAVAASGLGPRALPRYWERVREGGGGVGALAAGLADGGETARDLIPNPDPGERPAFDPCPPLRGGSGRLRLAARPGPAPRVRGGPSGVPVLRGDGPPGGGVPLVRDGSPAGGRNLAGARFVSRGPGRPGGGPDEPATRPPAIARILGSPGADGRPGAMARGPDHADRRSPGSEGLPLPRPPPEAGGRIGSALTEAPGRS